MVNLDDLLKELKSNKKIEFERLKKEFINDDVIIEMGNCEKSFVEEWYVAMAGQKFAGQNWKTGEDWKYTIEDYPQVARALAQNEHTNKDTIQYILFFAKGLEKDDNKKSLGYTIQDLVFAHPVFPETRYDIFEGGADFYESMAGSLALLPTMLKNPNYPSDGLMMILNKIENIDSKISDIIESVLSHNNFTYEPNEIKNPEISKIAADNFIDGKYIIIDNIEIIYNCRIEKIALHNEYKSIKTIHGDELDEAWRKFIITDAHVSTLINSKEDLLTILKSPNFSVSFNLDELNRLSFEREDQCDPEKLNELNDIEKSNDDIPLGVVANIFKGDDGDNYILDEIEEEIIGNGFSFNANVDFPSPPFEQIEEDSIFDGLYLSLKASAGEVYFSLNGKPFHFVKDELGEAIKVIN